MENFYLAYVVNGLIGLFVGYVWGVYDGFRQGSTGLRKPLRAILRRRRIITHKSPKTLRTALRASEGYSN